MAVTNAYLDLNIDSLSDPGTVHVHGSPEDVEHLMGHEDLDAILVAGYDVKYVADAEHDGFPAKRLTLAVDGTKEIGRLIVRTDVQTEYTFEFDALFRDVDAAERYVERIKNPPAKPKALSVQTDLVYGEDGETLDEAIARLSAEFGVSISVLNPHGPGGGAAVVKLTGTPERLHAALTGYPTGWGYGEDDMRETYPEVLKAASLG